MFSNLIMTCNKTLAYLVLRATYFIHHEIEKLRNRRMINRLFSNTKANPFKNDAKSKTTLHKGGSRARELCALAP